MVSSSKSARKALQFLNSLHTVLLNQYAYSYSTYYMTIILECF